jgi:hypothetical protein
MWTQGVPGAADGNWDGSEPNVLTWSNNQDGFDSQNWLSPSNLNDEVPAGKGFMAYIFDLDDLNDPNSGGFNKQMSVSGVPNQPDVSPELNNSNGYVEGWSLVGNPFEESIAFADVSKTNLTNVAYIYDPNMNETTNGNNGGWKTTDGSIGEVFNGEIAPFQGFFVQNDASGNPPSLTFTEGSKTTGSANFYGKQTDSYFVRLKISGEAGENTAWIRFSDHGSFDKTTGDALELYPFEEDYLLFAFEKEGKRLDIAQLPLQIEEHEVPVSVETNIPGVYTITVTDTNLPANVSLELIDRETGERIDVYEKSEITFEWKNVAKRNPLFDRDKNQNNLADVVEFEPVSSVASEQPRFVIRSVSTESDENTLPDNFTLHQNYPNPFNPTTIISYDLPENTEVNLSVYDMMGRRVATIVNENVAAGSHRVEFDAGTLSSGTYMYRLQAGGNIQTKKLTLIK